MLLSDKQRQCMMDFFEDKNSDHNKMVFILHFLEANGLIDRLADFVGNNYKLSNKENKHAQSNP
jgi:hypothetical protein